MAQNWIKVTHWLPDKPEVMRMAELLKVDKNLVLGACLRFWIWADQQTIVVEDRGASALADGCCMFRATQRGIDEMVRLPGFCRVMIAVGWLHVSRGVVMIPNFERHNGETAKQRALTNNRVEKHRARPCNAASVTKALRDAESGARTCNAPSVTKALPDKIRKEEEPPLSPPFGKGGHFQKRARKSKSEQLDEILDAPYAGVSGGERDDT